MKNSPDQKAKTCYKDLLSFFLEKKLPFFVGGTYALNHYTGMSRDALDLDLFCKKEDLPIILKALNTAGYATEEKFPWWLAKVYKDNTYTDIIYNHGNGVDPVDETWFERLETGEVLGFSVPLMGPEEIIWTKAYIQTRERFDGPDIQHLFLKRGPLLDWRHLYHRFHNHWQILLSHLIMFSFIYPSEREIIPSWIVEELMQKMQAQLTLPPPRKKICNGTLLSIGTDYSDSHYFIDVTAWGFIDPRPLENRPKNIHSSA